MSISRAVIERIANAGQGRDKVLAHINPEEAELLARIAGVSINPKTGLPQFGLFGSLFGGLFGGGGGDSAQTQYLNTIKNITAPLRTEGQNLINQYQSGTLNTGDQLALNQGIASSKSYLNQFYANAGLGQSSQLANQLGNVDVEGAITRQQLLNNYLTQGANLYAIALGPYAQAASGLFQAQEANPQAGIGALGNVFGSLLGNPNVTSAIGSLFSNWFGSGGGSSAAVDFG